MSGTVGVTKAVSADPIAPWMAVQNNTDYRANYVRSLLGESTASNGKRHAAKLGALTNGAHGRDDLVANARNIKEHSVFVQTARGMAVGGVPLGVSDIPPAEELVAGVAGCTPLGRIALGLAAIATVVLAGAAIFFQVKDNKSHGAKPEPLNDTVMW